MAADIGLDRSGRVTCKKCGHRIEINTLRMVWYRIERLRANWCRIECFANVQCEKRPFVFHNLNRYGFKVENLIGFFDFNRSDKFYVGANEKLRRWHLYGFGHDGEDTD